MQVAARFSGAGLPYEGLAYRNSSGAHWTGQVNLIEKHLEDPLRWQRPRRIFVNSMSDLFHPAVETEWLNRIFEVMWKSKQHTFQVLTKRPDRMLDYISRNMWLTNDPLPNVWLGVSCEDQKTADERILLLMETPAAVRWISAEPLLGPIDLEAAPTLEGSIDWVVVGGESGPGARPMHPDWARWLRDQCVAAGVPFFFKQWGEYDHGVQGDCSHWSSDGAQGPAEKLNPQRVDVWRCNICKRLHGEDGDYPIDFAKTGKKAAGRTLDGRTWSEYPEVK